MVILPVTLFLLALCVDLGLTCLGKRFFVSYPVSGLHKYTAIVTLYTYHDNVNISRVDQFEIQAALKYEKEVRANISLTRFEKVMIQHQFNDTIYELAPFIFHAIHLDGDKDFGVNLMLLGQTHSVTTMTIIPVEYHGTEYYPFFLSRNQVFIALFERLNKTRANLEITFYSQSKKIQTFHTYLSHHMSPYVCNNYEANVTYRDTTKSTAVGFPIIVSGGTASVVVGNCKDTEKIKSDSSDCSDTRPDDLLDMSLATQYGAKEFIAFKGIHNEPDRAYITAMGLQDNTSVNVHFKDKAHVQLEIKTGQTAKVNLRDPYQLITSSRAIQIYLIFTSHCNDGEVGGPSMTSLIPNALFQNRYIWSLPYHLKNTMKNYMVVFIKANQDYGFVLNGNNSATEKWHWSHVSGTAKWIASENKITDFWDVFTFSSSTNRAFGLYLYGEDIAISYLHFVDFMNVVTFQRHYACSETSMVVGDQVDNDCDDFPDEESSLTSDDDGDGKRGEDVRSVVPKVFNQELTDPPTTPTTTTTTTTTTTITTTTTQVETTLTTQSSTTTEITEAPTEITTTEILTVPPEPPDEVFEQDTGISRLINNDFIGDNDTFTMTCNYSGYSDNMKSIITIKMCRKLESKEEEEIIGIREIHNGFIYPIEKKIPKGRKWRYRSGVRNRNTLFLSLIVEDASQKDAGEYWCVINERGNSQENRSAKFNLKPQGPSVFGYPITNKRFVGNNDTFTMICNNASFRHTTMPAHPHFTNLRMYRKLDVDSTVYFIGSYKAFVKNRTNPLFKNIPDGRDWELNYGGGASTENRATMFISVTVKDARCTDAGVYTCAATLYGSNIVYYSVPFRLDARATNMVKMNPIKVTPQMSGSYNTSHNAADDTATMECTFTGEERMVAIWSLNKKHQQHNLYVEDFVSDPFPGTDGCPTYYHRSTKAVVLDSTYSDAIFYCRAISGRGKDTGLISSMQFILVNKFALHSKSQAASINFEKKAAFVTVLIVLIIC